MEEQVQTAKNIAFEVLKYMSPSGDKAGRYVCVDFWRNQLTDIAAKKLGVEAVDEQLRQQVEQELKLAWRNILDRFH